MSSDVSVDKPLELLRGNIADLEAILEHRKIVYQNLVNDAARAAGNNNSNNGNNNNNSSSAHSVGYRSAADEARQLAQRNAFLREQLAKVQAVVQQRASDPRVLDKRNEVIAVRRQIRGVEAEIGTLSVVQRRRDVGLRAIDKDEQRERQVRRLQQQRSGELRAQVKALTTQLRRAKRADMEAHAQYTRLLDVVKLNVREADVQQLEHAIAQQEAALAQQKAREQQLHDDYAQRRRRQQRERDALQRQLTQERHECRQLELTLGKLQKQLRWHTSQFATAPLSSSSSPLPPGGTPATHDVTTSPAAAAAVRAAAMRLPPL